MRHRLTAGLAIIALCAASATPSLAQEYRFAGFDGPRGTTASFNLRVPLGSPAEFQGHRPSLGFTVGHARAPFLADSGAPASARLLELVDIRFDRRGLRRAQMASFDLAHLDGDARLAVQGDEPGRNRTLRLVLIGLLGVAVGVGAEMLIDGSADEEETAGPTPSTPTPG